MVRLTAETAYLGEVECPSFDSAPFVTGAALGRRRVAMVSTAGLHRCGDRPFSVGSGDYRVIAGDIAADDLVMSHISTNYDRSGFQQDLNTIFPIDRLREMAAAGEIGSVAAWHYSFMGATAPERMEADAAELAVHLKADGVDAVFLVGV